VRPSVYAKAPPGYVNPFTLKVDTRYDPIPGLVRRGLNSALFDAAITRRQGALIEAWERLRQAEAGATPAQQKTLVRAHADLQALPIGEPATDSPLALACERRATDPAADTQCAAAEREWDAFFDAHYAEAKTLAEQVLGGLPGVGPHGGTNPHPTYGDQLNEQGIPGVPGEGRAEVSYCDLPVRLGDGTVVTLRQPHLTLKEPGYGPFDNLLTSPRIGPSLTGLGLLEAVPEVEILAWADPWDFNGDGISGRPNFVWDAAAQRHTLGRFGLKANVPTLRQQIAGAFVGDMGITSPLFPAENCTKAQSACAAAPNGGNPELSPNQLDAITFYLQTLAVPAQHGGDLPQVCHGEALFYQVGCAACHRPQMYTAPDAKPVQLAGRLIAPYTDLLLHDLGAPLADGRPDFQASGSEWRTAPLWGIGLAETVGEQVGYLHDGRARTLLEAILWHWGEAAPSREAVRAMGAAEREALLAFLRSL
jgi:Di-haem oxidoreductase, putative peroxidase